jgi:hypothetical protein
MKLNPMSMMKIKSLLEKFKSNHPKVPKFMQAASTSVGVGSIIELSVTSPEGKKILTNIKVTQDDIDLINEMKNLMQNQ